MSPDEFLSRKKKSRACRDQKFELKAVFAEQPQGDAATDRRGVQPVEPERDVDAESV